MDKGITFRVVLYVTGDVAPADDFAQIGEAFVRDALDKGQAGNDSRGMRITIRSVTALEGSDASDEG